jgi:hypothetical protein
MRSFGEGFDATYTYAPVRKAQKLERTIGSTEWLADMANTTDRALTSGKSEPKPRGNYGITHLSPILGDTRGQLTRLQIFRGAIHCKCESTGWFTVVQSGQDR